MNKGGRKEQVVDWRGNVLSLPMSHKDRKKWTEENLDRLSYLEYYMVKVDGRSQLIKVPLDKYRKRQEEEYGTKF